MFRKAKRVLGRIGGRFGFDFNNCPISFENGFELYNYLSADGTFDYEEYKKIQEEGNKNKIHCVWVIEKNIKFLSDYVKGQLENVKFGLCHGTRQGREQEWFKKYLKCEVLGTEISDSAEQFPDTINWDFHKVKPEWLENVDFIYSNSFDHSYDPQKCLRAWMSCLKPGGVCIIEHTSAHEKANKLDPFGANVFYMPYLVLMWGGGDFCVTEVLDAPEKIEALQYNKYLIIKNCV